MALKSFCFAIFLLMGCTPESSSEPLLPGPWLVLYDARGAERAAKTMFDMTREKDLQIDWLYGWIDDDGFFEVSGEEDDFVFAGATRAVRVEGAVISQEELWATVTVDIYYNSQHVGHSYYPITAKYLSSYQETPDPVPWERDVYVLMPDLPDPFEPPNVPSIFSQDK